jgi:hypothetical protein
VDEIEAAFANSHSRFATSIVNLTNFETLARPCVVSKKPASGYATGMVKTSTRNGLPPCHGLSSVYGARKP